MVTLDLSKLTITECNEKIRECGQDGQDVEVINPDARHNIGVGLTDPINVTVKGSAGYFCGGLSHGATYNIEHNVGWAVGDNIYAGACIVGGNAGAIAGVGLRGGEVVVRGNMGSRAGQIMKSGTLLCGGDCAFMAGYINTTGAIDEISFAMESGNIDAGVIKMYGIAKA